MDRRLSFQGTRSGRANLSHIDHLLFDLLLEPERLSFQVLDLADPVPTADGLAHCGVGPYDDSDGFVED